MYRVSVWANGGSALLILLGFIAVLTASTQSRLVGQSQSPLWSLGVVMIVLGFLILLGNSISRWRRA
jgi:hypothetical protein